VFGAGTVSAAENQHSKQNLSRFESTSNP